VLEARGELDGALRIRRDELLPVFERLGVVRERAVTLGKIADVLAARGELDEPLRIRREEELPVYERLGEVRDRAVTMGKIADVLAARGELDETTAERMRLPEAARIRSELDKLGEGAEAEKPEPV
jgi:phosphopentomutase